MQPAGCLNCGAALQPGQVFCPQCGQKTNLHRLSLHEIAHDALHYFTHADKGIFSLVRELALKPGKTAREYIAGKRKKYFPPLNFILIVAAIGLAVTGITNQLKTPQAAASPSVQSRQVVTEGDKAKAVRGAAVAHFFGKYYNIIPVVATPLISFFIWLFYFRSFNYAEHMVANMYIVGFCLLVYAVIFIPLGLWTGRRSVFIPYFLFEVTYRSISYYYFINRRNGMAIVKSVVSNLLLVAGWTFLTQWLISAYIQTGWWGLV